MELEVGPQINAPENVDDTHYKRAHLHLANSFEDKDISTAVREFLSHVFRIREDAIELRQKASEVSIGPTGYTAYRSISALENEYEEYHKLLTEARKSLLSDKPDNFRLLENNIDTSDISGSVEYAAQWITFSDEIISQIGIAFDELERTRTLITSKQSTAVTRLSVAVSTGILVFSVLTLLVSVVS